jgi:hypothetical protein
MKNCDHAVMLQLPFHPAINQLCMGHSYDIKSATFMLANPRSAAAGGGCALKVCHATPQLHMRLV